MKTDNPIEKRYAKRIKLSSPVHFQGKDPSQYGGCLSRDLSEGGIQVSLYDFVPIHSILTLQVQLAQEKVVDCLARVVWIEKHPSMLRYQVGLEFVATEDILKAKKEIYQFIKSYQS
ncbi:MAG TPA: hypothetical protein DD723_04040 [Candidatus Omnitrophica bacterium]|nr:MAG: hypothetical protein A2Z81_00260 [Omnitrophica WOR_2 bacterium GWA2_45_18]OGX19625.1 MAG: hypothetical protein A2Y04_02805 [Omnitrophica WOR_2 bacterium GWC2_45_7]HBR14701.1 hypothetical protein [Candidatus Omnitrophota bacterium]